jgi:hypothetical protein
VDLAPRGSLSRWHGRWLAARARRLMEAMEEPRGHPDLHGADDGTE